MRGEKGREELSACSPNIRKPEPSGPGAWRRGGEGGTVVKIPDFSESEPGRRLGILRSDIMCLKF